MRAVVRTFAKTFHEITLIVTAKKTKTPTIVQNSDLPRIPEA
jgi:hypothetical protein